MMMELVGKQQVFIDLVNQHKDYILVEAPAGTGKTFCCIQAAKALSDTGFFEPYQKALVLTFSRNARAQLIKELSQVPDNDLVYKHIEVNNYHSFFKIYLDAYHDLLGIQHPLSVVDDDDFNEQLHEYASAKKIKIDNRISCKILDEFSYDGKNLVILNPNSAYRRMPSKTIIGYLQASSDFTQDTGAICFSQFGAYFVKLLITSDDVVTAISHDYPIIILDEYQDTNEYQEIFLMRVLQHSRAIFFADRMQMIYSFRGSSPDRISMLPTKYPNLVFVELNEYFRYKSKPDIIEILTSIRKSSFPDYSQLYNGKIITCHAKCDSNWEYRGSGQFGKYCAGIFWAVLPDVRRLLRSKMSVAILCRTNCVAERISKWFIDNKFKPKTVSDTPEMIRLCKLIKKYVLSDDIENHAGLALAISAMCTISLKIDDIDSLVMAGWDYQSIKRKRKDVIKKIFSLIELRKASTDVIEKFTLVFDIIHLLEVEGYIINYSRRSFLEHCTIASEITPEIIDGIMLQRQYINSFSNITPGLYITTIHQSKGKEFDCVFIVDVDSLKNDTNLLYVSHSRMKELLYPIVVVCDGIQY